LENQFWVSQINTQDELSLEHSVEFTKLWEALEAVFLYNDAADSISWKLANDAFYTAKSAYKM
jgi:hypothetical protein